jgi:hypothetical protein
LSHTHGVVIIKPDPVAGCALAKRHQEFRYGEGMHGTDSLIRQLIHRNYWADISEMYYQVDTATGEVFGVAPYMRFDLDWPLLVQIPKWGGVFVIHTDGNIEDLSPQQAQRDQRLAGQRLYPQALAKRIGDAWAYRNGVLNAWLTHRDQAEIPTIYNSENQMPFLLPTQEGPQWSIVFEPHGQSFGVFEIMTVDARTGRVKVFKPEEGVNYIGVNKAEQFVHNAFPNLNWANNQSGNIVAIEPRPVVREGKLYWQLTLTNREHAAVQSTSLVDAINGQVVTVCSSTELDDFLSRKFSGRSSPCPQTVAGQTGQLSQPQPQLGGQPLPEIDVSELSPEEKANLARVLRDLANQIEGREPK